MVLAALLAVGVSGLVLPGEAAAGEGSRRQQLRFMWAMAQRESGGDYYARNRSSGAFGKYQIMPANWPGWADKYLSDPRADQTPYNQEVVARGKIRDLYRWLGSWERVAYWWLTGSTLKAQRRWSSVARGYVTDIMRLRKRAPADAARMPPRTSSKATRGDWRRAASDQKLRLKPRGRTWPARGLVRDGRVLRVRAAKHTPDGHRWIRVATVDGRLGWLRQSRTVPTRRPARPGSWHDVTDRGERPARTDRRLVRPQPH